MVYAYECKVATNWLIKRKTFMEDDKDALWTDDIQTNIDGYKYYFAIEKHEDLYAIYIFDYHKMVNTTIKRLMLSIPTADFEADMLLDADVPEDHKFYGYTNTVILKREDILNPENKFFENGILKIEFRGVLQFHHRPDTELLGEILWKSKDDKDITFNIGERQLKAHKLILRRFSSVFAESFDSNVDQIDIKDFDYYIVYNCIRMCYDFVYNENTDGLLECLRFADIYEMPIIKDQIAYELSEKIDTQNVCRLANKSIEFKCEALKGYCVSFILKCMKSEESYNGALDLKAEIVQEIYKSSVCHTVVS